ncbi:MAG: hypothetical protein V4726_14495 [Verrucomicrobiota bacterium]
MASFSQNSFSARMRQREIHYGKPDFLQKISSRRGITSGRKNTCDTKKSPAVPLSPDPAAVCPPIIS